MLAALHGVHTVSHGVHTVSHGVHTVSHGVHTVCIHVLSEGSMKQHAYPKFHLGGGKGELLPPLDFLKVNTSYTRTPPPIFCKLSLPL